MMTRFLLAAIVLLGFSSVSAQGVDCATQPGNLLTNCGFDADFGDWFDMSAEGDVTYIPDDGDGNPGAMEIDADDFNFFLAQVSHFCTPLTGGIAHDFGVSFRVVSGTSPISCGANLHFYEAGCSSYLGVSQIGASVEASDSEWRVFREENPQPAPPEAAAFTFQMNCVSDADFVVRFDDAVVSRVDLIFRDGFEERTPQ